MRLLLGFILGCLSFVLSAEQHRPLDFLASIQHDPQAIKKIYQHFCANCHAPHPLIPVGAPSIGDTKVWKRRLRQGHSMILRHTREGIGMMPARGGCFECSDEQIELLIKYITSNN